MICLMYKTSWKHVMLLASNVVINSLKRNVSSSWLDMYDRDYMTLWYYGRTKRLLLESWFVEWFCIHVEKHTLHTGLLLFSFSVQPFEILQCDGLYFLQPKSWTENQKSSSKGGVYIIILLQDKFPRGYCCYNVAISCSYHFCTLNEF